jgi:hypothetical protein
MKNTFKMFGIIALIAVIGFSMVGCPEGNNDSHTHSYGSTWSSNSTQHYKQCSCGEKIDVENHVGNPCTVCGYNSGGGFSLNGVWVLGGHKVTVSGSTGTFASILTTDPVWLDAIDKGYATIGGQLWRNITSTGNLTWSGQELQITSQVHGVPPATGTSWGNRTFNMSADGQTVEVNGNIWTRGNHSINGVWVLGGHKVNVSGSTGTFVIISTSDPVWIDAVNKKYATVGGQLWRNITSTGNLTWSGQELQITSQVHGVPPATGTSWGNRTFNMSVDGKTIEVNDNIWTREQ